MKKGKLALIMLGIMVMSFLLTTLISMRSVNFVIQKNNEEMAKILSSQIYNDINARLQRLIASGEMIVNTDSVIHLIENENQYSQDEMEQIMMEYLGRYTENLGYSSAFIVSEKSHRYYTQNGFNKVIDVENDEHDIWYQLFLEENSAYDFDIDVDQVNRDKWTVFLNARIVDDDGNLLGVGGIGLEMSDMQNVMIDMQEQYDIEINLVDSYGLVQIDVDDINIENRVLKSIKFNSSDNYQYQEIDGGYVVSKYMDELGWYLVVQKHNVDNVQIFMDIMRKNLIIMLVVFMVMMLITLIVMNKGGNALAQDAAMSSYSSLAKIYVSLSIIDLKNNTIREASNESDHAVSLFDTENNANEQIKKAILSRVEDRDIYKALEFGNLSTLQERLVGHKTITCEFLTKRLGWCRARFIVAPGEKEDDLRNVLMAIELIDEEKRKQEALRQETEEAKQASEAKGRFLANMSHEIRTPINAVLGLDTMILRESNEPNIREYAQDIENAGQTLLAIINDILDMSKIESGKMEIVPLEYELSSLIHDVWNMVNIKAESKGLEVHLEVDEHLPNALYGDDVRVRQILLNLMNNAVKYTKRGSVTLIVTGQMEDSEAALAQDDENSNENDNVIIQKHVMLHFAIKDTGVGIKEEDLHKLFDEFARIDEANNRNIEGTGLGINITTNLLKLMDSKLEVQSEYGVGSVFSFDLRQGVRNNEELGNIKERRIERAKDYSYEAAFIAPDARLLVVDDNRMNRSVFAKLLKELEIRIDEAASGAEALELIKKNAYDIIFLDHMMPGMDGVQVLQEMRRWKHEYPNQDTPVYVLTANAVAGAREKYLQAGFTGYLSKPINPNRLEKTIEQLLPEEKKLPAQNTSKKTVIKNNVLENDGDMQDSFADITSHFPSVDGIDWEYAIMKMADEELLREIIRDYVKLSESDIQKLERLYEAIPEDGVDPFRIKVHGMKSTSAMIGAMNVSALARVLEYAARDNDLERIQTVFGIFAGEWRELRKQLEDAFPDNSSDSSNYSDSSNLVASDAVEKKPIDKAMLRTYLGMLSEAMKGGKDLDTADAIVEELKKYSYNDDEQARIDRLIVAEANLDSKQVQEIVEEWNAASE